MPGERIELEGLVNTRDLGGYVTTDGRRVRKKRLLRSGALWPASEDDITVLKEKYGLKRIVDFRTRTEREERPDPVIDGVEYIVNPILEEAAMGITHEHESRPSDLAEAMVRMCLEVGEQAEMYLAALYPKLVTQEHSIARYRKFFDILLESTEGAVLYHCSEGKDRVGTGTALVLSALSVDKDTILRDYMLTGRFTEEKRRRMFHAIRERYSGEMEAKQLSKIGRTLELMSGVQESYLQAVFEAVEKNFGSMERFLKEKMGLDEERSRMLQEKYLE